MTAYNDPDAQDLNIFSPEVILDVEEGIDLPVIALEDFDFNAIDMPEVLMQESEIRQSPPPADPPQPVQAAEQTSQSTGDPPTQIAPHVGSTEPETEKQDFKCNDCNSTMKSKR